MTFPSDGAGSQGSELDLILQDVLSGMGNFVAQNQGSLAWCEAYAKARMFDAALSTVRLLAQQSEPAMANISLPMWRDIFLNAPSGDDTTLLQFIQQLTLQVGTPPTLSNVKNFLQGQLGKVFLTLEWIPLQNATFATFAPPATNQLWSSPVSNIMVHCWQPRDNEDNILLPQGVWVPTLNSWQNLVQNWVPANCFVYNVVPSNAGGDGYGNSNLYDGYNNPVTIVAGSQTVNSTLSSANSTFETDFRSVYTNLMTGQLLEIVDDNNQVQTYYVESVQSNTQLTLTTPAVSNCTARTYRTFGYRVGITPLGPQAVCN
jgi:hypothetical protein